MSREILIYLYLTVTKVFFTLFKLIPLRSKTILISSFGDNTHFVWDYLMRNTNQNVIILKTPGSPGEFNSNNRSTVIQFRFLSIGFIKGIYHLATSRFVMVDNYFGVLAATPFKKEVKCIQLWHANGAIKQFGLKDPSLKDRSKRAVKRFKRVYDRFTHTVVGSEHMAEIFKKAFLLNDNTILRTGIPRTDFFLDDYSTSTIQQKVYNNFPKIHGKKVILYAPTFRDQQIHKQTIEIDIENLYMELSDDYVLMLRLHPVIKDKFQNDLPNFIIDVSTYPELNHLLLITDYLITDYSSIPFEFALLNKPMIFYPYDLENYRTERGFWQDYESLVPGPVAKSTQEIIDLIKRDDFDIDRIKEFSKDWNQYNNGKSTEKLIQYVYKNKD